MKFGVFDHLDDAGIAHEQFFDNRLRLVEAYDKAGFHAYHLAEHHATPLGIAASPGLFLTAVRSAPRRCASGRWSICCRSTIRCG